MPQTPLLDALRAFSGRDRLPMHMPGHKGKPLPVPELAGLSALDFTELGPTGDLFEGGGPIGAAQELWSAAFHMAHCLFLTGGSTQGMLSALTLACAPGSALALDRGSHRSVYNALALLDLTPVYLSRPFLSEPGVAGPISPRDVENLLRQHPEIKTVCITSPTYYGVLSDLPALAEVVHTHGGIFVVDAAHGGHLPFLENFDLSAADLAVVSAHKTLPAPGQTALLFSNGAFSHRALRRAAAVYGSSSPSYALMAALDGARAYLETQGAADYRRTAALVAALRERTNALRPCHVPLDPCRYVLCCADGLAAQRALEARGTYVEMADVGHIVCILTCMDGAPELRALEWALSYLPKDLPAPVPPPPLPEQACSPRSAFFAHRETVPLTAAEGRICALSVAPYPPGIPILAPGERITKKTIAYLDRIGYNMLEDIEVVHI